ncbi:site-2 protease family protein [Candidatus Wolfebacteria bacterium]|nr:site-2 protease family protein [Candidatus Wolfebacteria bacterium]
MNDVSIKLFLYAIIVLSATFHEYAHGFIAFRLGDSTAKDAGRLTLNPFAHIDLFGTVIIPLFLLFYGGIFIGWAKPVPYNPYNLKDKKYGSLKVGIAGPGANLLIALILGIFLRIALLGFFGQNIFSPLFLSAVGLIIYINIFLALFNLIPIPPLDGSKVLMDLFPDFAKGFMRIGFVGIFFAMAIAFFVLPTITNVIFELITGQGFIF